MIENACDYLDSLDEMYKELNNENFKQDYENLKELIYEYFNVAESEYPIAIEIHKTIYKCPKCHTYLNKDGNTNFCHICGQSIDWDM